MSVLHQAGSNVLDGASYTYDATGNRSSKTNYLNGTTSNYTYDPLYELTQVTQGGNTTESYTYDAVGNRLSSLGTPSYQYNASNELTSSSLGAFTYDTNGNTFADASGKTYTWDFENRLTQAVVPGTGTVSFKYDPFGRRIQKSSVNQTFNYVYDGITLVDEIDNSGGILAVYAEGPQIDEPLAQSRSGVTSYYQQDALGTVSSLSNTAGSITNTYSYSSLGAVSSSTGTLVNPFRFTGRELDSETGLYYYRARYYDSISGRFTSQDSLWTADRPNLYMYALNNPIRLRDFSGQQQEEGPDEGLAEEVMEERDRENNALEPVEPNPVLPPIAATVDYQPEPTDSTTSCGCPPLTVGQRVYRIFGGGAGPWGRSWSRDWFSNIQEARNALGLPESPANAGEWVIEGEVLDPQGATVHPAAPLGNRSGGGDEVEFSCPKRQVRVTGLYPMPPK